MSNYKIFPNYAYLNEANLKARLVQIGPLSVDFYADTPFYSYTGGVYNIPCPSSVPVSTSGVNHGVLLVGYGRDPVHGKYWKAKNR